MEVNECVKQATENQVEATDESKDKPTKREEEDKDGTDFKKPMFISRPPIKNRYKILLKQKISASQNENVTADADEDVGSVQNLENKPKAIPFPYEEPLWKGVPDVNYHIEELKSGTIERIIKLEDKSFVTFGRVDVCDIDMSHPTVSRFHAVLQYRAQPDEENEKGFYIYDLGSTHGTFLNKYRIKTKVYARVKVGHMIKIGCSSRLFLLQGPAEDQEEESEFTVFELKAQRQKKLEERQQKEEEKLLREQEEREREERLIEERGISWGMGEDADEETDLAENPYAVLTNEELYIDDPKKALRIWFEREGEELHFQTEKADKGMFICKLVLPIDDGDSREIIIEMSSRSKKESQFQCALEACRTIDKMGLLRPAKRESKKVQKRNWEENDYYDSDEDSFHDRTGDLDKKREKRMRKAGKIQDTVETYDSLMVKHSSVLKKIQEAEKKLNRLTSQSPSPAKAKDDIDELDALDAYMISLKHAQPKKIDIKIAKDELHLLKEQETNLRKLINIAKPANMPELIKPVVVPVEEKEIASKPKKIELVKHPSTEVKDETKIKKSKPAVGPTIPQNLKKVQDKYSESNKNKSISSKKDNSKENENTKYNDDYNDLVWQPPDGQTGDGRTALNDKYGY